MYSVNKTITVANESKWKWNGADKVNSMADFGKAARDENNDKVTVKAATYTSELVGN